MCPGAMPGGVCCARWTQIDAIARADVPCRPVEWRLACQMICGKAWNRSLTAVRGRFGFFLQITARADVLWNDARRDSGRSMDTNRCHRASECALQARRMAIAMPDDLREKGTQGLHSRVCQVGVLPANHRASECALERCLEGFATLDGHKSMPSRELMCLGGP